MNQLPENTAAIEEEISNIVVELYDKISLFHKNNDQEAVQNYIESYIKRVTRIGFRVGKSNFHALRDSCVIFHEILEGLNKRKKPLTESQCQQFEVWPTLILSYIANPSDKNNIESLLTFLQDTIWDYQADDGEFQHLQDVFYTNNTPEINIDESQSSENMLTEEELSAPMTAVFDGALFESVQEEILEAF